MGDVAVYVNSIWGGGTPEAVDSQRFSGDSTTKLKFTAAEELRFLGRGSLTVIGDYYFLKYLLIYFYIHVWPS